MAAPAVILGGALLTGKIANGVLDGMKRRGGNTGTQEETEGEEFLPVELSWEDITVDVKRPKKAGGGTMRVLDSASGIARPGTLVAIMGPSGSGKTTLLNAVARHLEKSKRLEVKKGKLKANGKSARELPFRQAYVTQDDAFYAQLTVRETLLLAARLRLPRAMDDASKQEHVNQLLNHLGLSAVADMPVGNEQTRGISGGEKKRLSIACELLGSPSVIFADEPTTGLDSFQAENVAATLRQLANEGHTVVCSVHQPRGSIWAKFDDLYLLSEGKLVYGGPIKDVIGFFNEQGLEYDGQGSAAEFVIDAVSVDYSSEKRKQECMKLIDRLASAASTKVSQHCIKLSSPRGAPGNKAAKASGQKPVVKPLQQFAFLLGRSWKQVTRDKAATVSRLTSTISSASTFAIVFFRLGYDQPSSRSRLGLLQVSAVSTAMTSMIKTIGVFSKEKVVVSRERARNLYDVGPYFASKIISETPVSAIYPFIFTSIVYPSCRLREGLTSFLRFCGVLVLESFSASGLGLAVSAATPSYEAATALGPALMTTKIVFSCFVDPRTVPAFLKFLPKISLIGRAYEGFAVSEFRGLKKGAIDGDAILKSQGLGECTLAGSCKSQGAICVGMYALTFVALKLAKPEFNDISASDVESTRPRLTSESSNEVFHEAKEDDTQWESEE